jgi:hypothetical protein
VDGRLARSRANLTPDSDGGLVPIQEALAFLGQARRDDSLGREIEALEADATVESLTEVADRAGFRFTSEELRRAHVLDWEMRWARYRT